MAEHLIDAEKVDEIFMAWVKDVIENHDQKAVGQVLGSPAIQSLFTGEIGQSVMPPHNCALCNIPIATGTCDHALVNDAAEQVTMSLKAWERLVARGTDVTLRSPENEQAIAIHDLASSVRFHGLLTGAQRWDQASIEAFRRDSR